MSDNYEQQLMYKYFCILKDFMECKTYEDKLDTIKKHWGNVKPPQAINYTDKCKVTIAMEEDEKVHVYFDCENADFEMFKKVHPELAEEYIKLYPPEEATNENVSETKKDSLPETNKESLDSNYLSNYYGLNINRNKNQKTEQTKICS